MSARSSDQPPRRRARKLTDEEQQLWEGVARLARPLRAKRPPRASEDATAVAEPRPSATKVSAIKAGLKTPPAPVPTGQVASPRLQPLATMPRRMKSRVGRGVAPIDARIDLHGMRQDEAFAALRRFLADAALRGHTLVLVITGKGRTAAPERERGVLRAKVPQWLASAGLRDAVIGFEEAHVGHGGAGALYVRIRKAKKPRA